MYAIRVAILFYIIFGINCENDDPIAKFPDYFKFGTATAAYQIEGAWNEDGKGESIWDRLTHSKPKMVSKCGTGDVATDSYHNYDRDIELLEELGVDYYRFSISWPRIFPTGFIDHTNDKGVNYYGDLIDALIAKNITPFVTLYHWDLPQKLQDLGGWANPIMESIFVDYATEVFKLYGDRVKNWITFNEPKEICYEGYEGFFAPSQSFPGYGPYICAHNLLKAHGKAYRAYEKEFKPKQQGRVGITLSSMWFESRNINSTKDVTAAETAQQFELGWFANPIYSEDGNYPTVMRSRISRADADNIRQDRLPTFSPEELNTIKGSADFFGLNHYTSRMCAEYVEGSSPKHKSPSYLADRGVRVYVDPKWPSAESSWLKVVPWGIKKLLAWITKTYGTPEIIIFENGFSDKGEMNDLDRVKYYRSYMEQVLKAMQEDSCNVTAYFAWSLMDNFEWLEGYTQKFGLYHVDFEDPNRKRTAKTSALVFKEIVRTKQIDYNYDPLGHNMRRKGVSYQSRKPRSVESGSQMNNYNILLLAILYSANRMLK